MAKAAKSPAKSKTNPKSEASSKPAKAKRSSKSQGMVAQAGSTLDTMAAGAVVGAVKAAARAIDENEVKALKGRGKRATSTADVLGEMGPDAALGAVVGAAGTVLPVEEKAEEKAPARGGSKSRAKKS
ncbi:hypothetical protein [Paludisphaera sp.]|uniref:hypothetical protein n=1 Tax=Paludisphaera sp. TaxID=2017432 RepID=UPI00301CC4EE